MANLREIEKLLNKNFKNNKDWGEEVNRKGAAYADNEKFERIEEKLKKELKKAILEDLSVWELGWQGELVVVPGTPVSLVDGGSINFSEIDQKEIICAFIKEIKQNPQDWKIEMEDKNCFNDPSQKNLEDYWLVKHKSGRKHYRGYQFYNNFRPGFSDEEWKEIENVLNSQEQKLETSTNPSSSEQWSQQKQLIAIFILISFLIIGLVFYAWLKKRK